MPGGSDRTATPRISIPRTKRALPFGFLRFDSLLRLAAISRCPGHRYYLVRVRLILKPKELRGIRQGQCQLKGSSNHRWGTRHRHPNGGGPGLRRGLQRERDRICRPTDREGTEPELESQFQVRQNHVGPERIGRGGLRGRHATFVNADFIHGANHCRIRRIGGTADVAVEVVNGGLIERDVTAFTHQRAIQLKRFVTVVQIEHGDELLPGQTIEKTGRGDSVFVGLPGDIRKDQPVITGP